MYNGDVKLAIVTCVAKVMNITDNRWATCQQNGSILECELSVRCLPWTRVSGSVFQKAVETLGRRVSLEEVGHWEWALKSKCTASLAACSRLREHGGYVTSCLPPALLHPLPGTRGCIPSNYKSKQAFFPSVFHLRDSATRKASSRTETMVISRPSTVKRFWAVECYLGALQVKCAGQLGLSSTIIEIQTLSSACKIKRVFTL